MISAEHNIFFDLADSISEIPWSSFDRICWFKRQMFTYPHFSALSTNASKKSLKPQLTQSLIFENENKLGKSRRTLKTIPLTLADNVTSIAR